MNNIDKLFESAAAKWFSRQSYGTQINISAFIIGIVIIVVTLPIVFAVLFLSGGTL